MTALGSGKKINLKRKTPEGENGQFSFFSEFLKSSLEPLFEAQIKKLQKENVRQQAETNRLILEKVNKQLENNLKILKRAGIRSRSISQDRLSKSPQSNRSRSPSPISHQFQHARDTKPSLGKRLPSSHGEK